MAIRRLTIELDDAPDQGGQTTVPEGLQPHPEVNLKERDLTSAPTAAQTQETDSPEPNAAPLSPRGRTLPDLVAEFVNEPRAMATILTLVAFIVFVAKIDSLSDVVYPIVLGGILNAVWFGVPWLVRAFR